MKMTARKRVWSMLREHLLQLLRVAARHHVVARGQLHRRRRGLDVGRDLAEAAARRSRPRCAPRAAGPCGGWWTARSRGPPVATSPRGTRILSPLASSLSVGTRRASRSSAKRRWSARRRTRTSWVSPAASSIVVATSPVTAARRVIADRGDVQAEVAGPVAVELDAQLGLALLEARLDVRQPGDLPHRLHELAREAVELVHLRPAHAVLQGLLAERPRLGEAVGEARARRPRRAGPRRAPR